MTRSFPNEPLCPRAPRSGMSVATRSSSSFVAPDGNGTDAGVAGPLAGMSRRPKPTGPRSGTLRLLIAVRWGIRRERLGTPGDGGRRKALDRGEDPPLALVEPLLDVEREDVAPSCRPDAERDRHCVVGFVGDRDSHPFHAELLGTVRGAAVETDGRLPGRQPLDLDVAPSDAADPEAEHLRDGFLGGPPPGHGLRPPADVPPFGLGQHPPREALAEAFERRANPVDLDDVDAEFRRPRRDRAIRHRRPIPP